MSDHLSTCPACADLNGPGLAYCASCGAPLTTLAASRTVARARAAAAIRASCERDDWRAAA